MSAAATKRGGVLAVFASTMVGILVVFMAGFGTNTACTNDYSCTDSFCPSACDRIEIATFAGCIALAVVLVLAVMLGRRSQGLGLRAGVALTGLAIAVTVVAVAVMSSYPQPA